MSDLMTMIMVMIAFPMGTFIAGIFLGLKLAPQRDDDSHRVVVIQPTPDTNNNWPTSIDTGGQQ